MTDNELLKIRHFNEIQIEINNSIPDDFSGKDLRKVVRELKLSSRQTSELFSITRRTLRNWYQMNQLSRIQILAMRSILAQMIVDRTNKQPAKTIETVQTALAKEQAETIVLERINKP